MGPRRSVGRLGPFSLVGWPRCIVMLSRGPRSARTRRGRGSRVRNGAAAGWLTQRAGAQPAPPAYHSEFSQDFQPIAFGPPSAPARLTQAQAIALAKGAFWSLGKATNVTAQYTGWTSQTMFHRTEHGGVPYGRRDVWKVTAQMTTDDPGGAQACPTGATAATCPGLRVYQHMVVLVDDKAGKAFVASPY